MALLRTKNLRTRLVGQFVLFAVWMFVLVLLVNDASVTRALVTAVLSASFYVASLWWLTRRGSRQSAKPVNARRPRPTR